jgi:phosphohistidine phosphatase
MRTLLLLRHGKAEDRATGGDHARALTRRGSQDSATIGERIQTLGLHPDAVVTSDARRAGQTAEIVAGILGPTAPLTREPRIYLADEGDLLQVVRDLPDARASVLLVGHNPGFQDLANLLAGGGVDNLPTGGLVYLELPAPRWQDVQPGSATLRGVYGPKDGR